MLITAFEDCAGNPFAATTAMAASYTTERTGLPECMIPMALATCEMAMSKRNKSAYYAIKSAMGDVRENATIHVPPGLRAGTMGYVKAITKTYLSGWCKDWDTKDEEVE
jgi:replication-associated recombination protein RarA